MENVTFSEITKTSEIQGTGGAAVIWRHARNAHLVSFSNYKYNGELAV